jgi:hypothetical protein
MPILFNPNKKKGVFMIPTGGTQAISCAFSYSAASYTDADPDPTPTVTGTSGGTFTSTAGIVINADTGEIDLSASTLNTYVITYTVGAKACTQSVEITASYANTYSMEFDGIDEGMTVPSFTTSGNDLTVSLWLKAVNLSGGSPSTIGSFVYGNASNYIYYNTNEVIYAAVNGNTSYIVANSGGVPQIFGLGNWHHLAITKTGSTLTWWIDGVSYASSGTSGTGGFTMDSIGADVGGTRYYLDGNLDEIAIWQSDQSSNMATIYGSGVPSSLASLNPLFWARMGEKGTWSGSAWTLTDQGSGGNDATSVNMEEADRQTDVPS